MAHFTFNSVTIWLSLGILAAVVEVLSPLFGFIFITETLEESSLTEFWQKHRAELEALLKVKPQ